MSQRDNPVRAESRPDIRAHSRTWFLNSFIFACILIAVPAAAGAMENGSILSEKSGPGIVHIGIYIVDFNRFSVADGTVEANFYLTLKSDNPVSINDFEIMNGHATSIDTILDTPHEKIYRIVATLTADPDLRRFPFDRHTLPIEIEPKLKNELKMVLVIDPAEAGLDPEADLPGWEIARMNSAIINKSYYMEEAPYSRAIFDYGIGRDGASTILKFFLPILLIIIVSLSSLMMKISSRLGLNASMFLAAVLIHWRVADAIPLVAYATFLDLFMIITYATLVMVLVSGILILKFTEDKDTVRVNQINFWSIRMIPPLSLALYSLLFLSLVL